MTSNEMRIPPTAFKIYTYLKSINTDTISQIKIAQALFISERTCRDSTKWLEYHGIITRTVPKFTGRYIKPTTYTLLSEDLWKL